MRKQCVPGSLSFPVQEPGNEANTQLEVEKLDFFAMILGLCMAVRHVNEAYHADQLDHFCYTNNPTAGSSTDDIILYTFNTPSPGGCQRASGTR